MEQRILDNVLKMRQAGADDAEIDVYLREEKVKRGDVLRAFEKQKTLRETGIDTESSFLGALGQGASFGFSDEILAGARAAGGADYDKALQAERDALRRYRGENPGKAAAGEIAGGLATGFVPVLGQVGRAAQGASMARQAATAAAGGAALGGLAGFGSAEGDLGDRLAGAGMGAALGGAVGGAVPTVMGASRAAGSRAKDMLGLRSAAGSQTRADELLATAWARDGKSPDEIRAMLQQAADQNKPLGILDVTGQNTLGLGRAAANVPSTTKETAFTRLNERAMDAPARISGDLQEAMGVGNQSYLDLFDTITQKLRTSSKPLYDKAYSAGDNITDPTVLRFLSPDGPLRTYLPRLWADAQEQAALEGDSLINPFKKTVTDGIEVLELRGGVQLKTLDYMKRALDDIIYAEKGNKKRLLGNVKRELVGELDNRIPEYKAARSQYRGDAEMRDALEGGRSFLSERSDITMQTLKSMTDPEKQAFRVGAITAIRDAINTAADRADVVRRIFGSPEKRAQLRAVFPSDDAYRTFEARMKLEAQATQSRNSILAGSRTTPLAQEIDDMARNPALMVEAAGSPLRGIGRIAATELLANRMQGVRGAVADALNNRLMDFNPSRQMGVVDQVAKTQQQMAQDQARRQMIRRGLGQGLGTVPGLFVE
jgi:hypothetical protein